MDYFNQDKKSYKNFKNCSDLRLLHLDEFYDKDYEEAVAKNLVKRSNNIDTIIQYVAAGCTYVAGENTKYCFDDLNYLVHFTNNLPVCKKTERDIYLEELLLESDSLYQYESGYTRKYDYGCSEIIDGKEVLKREYIENMFGAELVEAAKVYEGGLTKSEYDKLKLECQRIYITRNTDIKGKVCKIYKSQGVVLYYVIHKSLLIVTNRSDGHIFGTKTVYSDNLVYNTFSETLFFKESGAWIWDYLEAMHFREDYNMYTHYKENPDEAKLLKRLLRDSMRW